MIAKRSTKPAPKPAAKAAFTAKDIVLRDPDELIPFPNNPKKHTPEQIDLIALNISQFGFDQPCLVDEDSTVLKGHGRRLAARKLGIMVPTIVRKGLSYEDKLAVVISDNALPAITGFDDALLRIGMTTLAKVDYNLKLTGFGEVRLATFIGGGSGTGADETPEVAETSISKLGDVWQLGDHVLICGDSSDKAVMAKALAKKPKLMLTDPPYNFETRGGGIHIKKNTRHAKQIGEAGIASFDVATLAELVDTNVIFTSKDLLADYLDLARAKKLTWDVGVLHRTAALPAHNNHLIPDLDYVVMMGKLAPKRGLEHSDYSKLFSTGHWDRPLPWAKPVELMARLLRLFSDAGDSVLEPYAGSGTTIIAAEQLGRACAAIELNPVYVDLAVRRWQKFASKTAILAGTKKTFAQVEKERSKNAA